MSIAPLHPRDILSGSAEQGFKVEDISLERIAHDFGTPCYVYSQSAIEGAWSEFTDHLGVLSPMICFAVKANPNLALLNLLSQLGAGFDIVSGGELARVIAAGGDPHKVVFSGVGKSTQEMEFALRSKVFCFNVESEAELERLNQVASQLDVVAPVSLRVNPDVDAHTHPYIATGLKDSKFGVAWDHAIRLYERATQLKNLAIRGVDCHIGSQITDLSPFGEALDRLLYLVDALQAKGIHIEHIDVGGGVGIQYRDEPPPKLEDYAKALIERLQGRPERLILEPGRRIVGNAGLLLTRVEYTKKAGDKHFALVDAAMNDLMRPALYEAWHEVVSVKTNGPESIFDIAGPVCESGDILARERTLHAEEGSLLAILSAGAYGSSMSSNYNTRTRPAEVLIHRSEVHLIRRRETLTRLWDEEIIPDTLTVSPHI